MFHVKQFKRRNPLFLIDTQLYLLYSDSRGDGMGVKISSISQVPIYQQIKQQIQELILSGEWEAGKQIPSIRQLAKDLRVGIITTTKAYDELVLEGFLISRPGIGFFVNSINHEEAFTKYYLLFEKDIKELVNKTKGTPISKETLIQIINSMEEE